MRLQRALERRVWRARQVVARSLRPVPCERVGPQLWRWGAGKGPRVLMVPGGLDDATALAGASAVAPAPWLARRGWVVYGFSPSGRGAVPGEEDFNGPQHQQELAEVLAALAPERPVVLSISFGLVAASAALAQHPSVAVAGLVDWEGPPSRRWFEAARIGAPPSDEDFWRSREAVRWLRRLSCPYVRVQSAWDHVHGPQAQLGHEAVDAALTSGVEVWFNDARLPAARDFCAPGLGAQSQVVLRQLERLTQL